MDTLTGQLVITEQEFLKIVGRVAANHGLLAQQTMPGQVRLSKKYTSAVVIVFAILLFPIGLLLLLVKSELVIIVQYNVGADGRGIGFALVASKRIASDFRTMLTPYEPGKAAAPQLSPTPQPGTTPQLPPPPA